MNNRNIEHEVKEWMEQVWGRAANDWIQRDQDLNYREYAVHPTVEEQVMQLETVKNGIYIDAGCGDGDETIFLRNLLEKKDFSGTLYGFDKQANLIDEAKRKHDSGKNICTIFDAGSLIELVEDSGIKGKADLVHSAFVFQEVPFIRDFIQDIAQSLRQGGTLLGVFVHPQFEDLMGELGNIRINDQLKHPEWDYCGEFPIVESGGSFYVPVFHRNLSRYVSLFEEHFYINSLTGIQPHSSKVQDLEYRGILPFCEHNQNVYYPYICEMPSSLLVTATRK